MTRKRADTEREVDIAAMKFVRRATRVHGINNGDVVCVRVGSGMATDVVIDKIAAALNNTRRKDCLVVAVENLDDLVAIADVETMRQYGWVRADASETGSPE